MLCLNRSVMLPETVIGATRAWRWSIGEWLRSLSSRSLLGVTCMAFLVLVAIAAAFPGAVTPHDPLAPDYEHRLSSPTADFWLGTDEFGRDIFSRIVWGAQVSLLVASMSILIGHGVGLVLGLVSAWAGGMMDALLQRLVDALLAVPSLVMAMAVIAVIGPSLNGVVVALAVSQVPLAARIMRSAVLSAKAEAYVDAAKALGASGLRILTRHVLPNSLSPIIVLATLGLGQMIIVESSLSFLGLGVPPPEPTWGGMLSGAATKYVHQSIWLLLAPGLAIAATVYSFTVVGDLLRDLWDPRSRRSVSSRGW